VQVQSVRGPHREGSQDEREQKSKDGDCAHDCLQETR
jgi:hypothetical protein